MDLFFVEWEGGSWLVLINFGLEINISGNEVFFFFYESGVFFFFLMGIMVQGVKILICI